MNYLIGISSEKNTKILLLKKELAIIPIIQEFLKDIGITRDWRKHFLSVEKKAGSFIEDAFYFSDDKKSSIRCSAFVGMNKLILQVNYDSEKEDFVLPLIEKHFT